MTVDSVVGAGVAADVGFDSVVLSTVVELIVVDVDFSQFPSTK